MHGHPHKALLNGLIEAAVAKNNKCTVLLSTDSVLHSRRLPDPKEWKDYVKFMSLDEGSASIDPETIKIENARVYNPHSTNNNSWERISNTLNKSSTPYIPLHFIEMIFPLVGNANSTTLLL